MTGSANEVVKTKLAFTVGKPKVGTTRAGTVFFKQHGDEAPSQNAVASTRLARFVGMPDIIAHNAFARIRGVEGVVSGKVTGKPMQGDEFLREVAPPSNAAPRAHRRCGPRRLRLVQRDGKYFDEIGARLPAGRLQGSGRAEGHVRPAALRRAHRPDRPPRRQHLHRSGDGDGHRDRRRLLVREGPAGGRRPRQH